MSAATYPSHIQQDLHALLLSQLKRSLWVNAPVAIICGAAAAYFVATLHAMLWLAIVLLTLLARAWALKLGFRSGNALAIGACASGVVWCCAFFLAPGLVPQTLQLFIALVISGMTASALHSLGANLLVYFAFAVPCWFGVILSGVLAGGIGYAVAAVGLLYGMTLSVYAIKMRAVLERSLALGYANAELVTSLTEERNAALLQREQRTRFLAVASHDLRQPAHAISLISSYLQILSDRAESPDSALWRTGLDRLQAGVSSM
jgi:signal transduction histidine kinase